jgi:hypothetical protein
MCSINHEKKAIFFHIPKTAGTFIRENLEKYYGFKYYQIKRPDHDEICNTNEYIEYIKKFYHSGNKIYGIIKFFKNAPHNKKIGIYEYIINSEYINKITNMDETKWNEYYKFCFIRNPYERFISGYNYSMNFLKLNIPFDDYINYKDLVSEYEYIHTFMPQSKHIFYNNINIINYMGSFENLYNDFNNILLKIGFTKDDIKHNNDKINSNPHYPINYYIKNQEILNKINKILEDDFKYLKFKKIEDIYYFQKNIL